MNVPTACYPETRIGAFDSSAATCTEPLGYGSADGQRACSVSQPGIAEDLFLFSQEDPLRWASGDPSLYSYASAVPTVLRDPLGLQATYVFPPPSPVIRPKPGRTPDFKCCSRAAIQEDLDSVEANIRRMFRNLSPSSTAGGGIADTNLQNSRFYPDTDDVVLKPRPDELFDPSIPKSGDPCVGYCNRVHEWVHFTDDRTYNMRWSRTQQDIHLEFWSYMADAACLRAAAERAGRP